MAEVLVEFNEPVTGSDGITYIARACGSETDTGHWHGWVEFLPVGAGEPVRTGRETTQPNRADTIYWATGLTPVYLEGALERALNRPVIPPARAAVPPVFDEPAPEFVRADPPDSILDPFSVYRKGEALLRSQLRALSGWHLVNIIRDYALSDMDAAALNSLSELELVELIVATVRERSKEPSLK